MKNKTKSGVPPMESQKPNTPPPIDETVKAAIKAYIKENLSIDARTSRGSYGMGDHVSIAIFLEGEEISQTYLDLP